MKPWAEKFYKSKARQEGGQIMKDEELITTSEEKCPRCRSTNIEDMGCAFEEGTESSKGPTKILYTCKDCGKKFLLLK